MLLAEGRLAETRGETRRRATGGERSDSVGDLMGGAGGGGSAAEDVSVRKRLGKLGRSGLI